MKKIITSLPFQLVLGVAGGNSCGATFWTLSYEGTITKQLPVFIWIVLIVIAGQFRHSLQHYRGRRAGHDPVRLCPAA